MKKTKVITKTLLSSGLILSTIITGCDANTLSVTQEKPSFTVEESLPSNAVISVEDDTINSNLFAFDFYDAFAKDENFMFSPYSINVTLSMLTNGSANSSWDELTALLHIEDIEVRNQACNAFLHKKYSGSTELYLANSVWISDQATLNESAEKKFFKPLEDVYQTERYKVDFHYEKTLDEINKWASKNTNQMIDPFLDSIDPHTKMSLLNAIYFKGEWQSKFEEDNTEEAAFYSASGMQQVETMHLYENEFRCIAEDGIKGIELPYGDGSTAMDILIPDDCDENSIYNLLSSKSSVEKLKLITAFNDAEYQNVGTLALPKFEFETSLMDLVPSLSSLGANDILNETTSDFSPISNSFYVSQVLQKAKIVVDENGTKAAAVTAVMMKDSCAIGEITEPYNFIIDHPFFYCIRDTQSGEILFMGYINEL